MPLAFIKYLTKGGGEIDNTLPEGEEPVDPGYGQGHPKPPVALPPIQLPPLPGLWPPAGTVTPPIHFPPAIASPPIFIPPVIDNTLPGGGGGTVTPPIQLPPPGIYPPLPPDVGINGKVAILVWVIGVGYRWAVFDTGVSVTPPIAETPTPK